ncbi:MAG: hypothetical protein HY673_23565 [Chloroflexi bacterium]|nr:hypothetical protein [Chloroflexota bacterium]
MDLMAVVASLNKKNGNPGFDAKADLNGDGIVDIYDLTIVGIHFGWTP